jgi:hypothetical protein
MTDFSAYFNPYLINQNPTVNVPKLNNLEKIFLNHSKIIFQDHSVCQLPNITVCTDSVPKDSKINQS